MLQFGSAADAWRPNDYIRQTLLELRRDFRSCIPGSLPLFPLRIEKVDPSAVPWDKLRIDSPGLFHELWIGNQPVRATYLGVTLHGVYGLYGPSKSVLPQLLNDFFFTPAIKVLRCLRDSSHPCVDKDTQYWHCGTMWLQLVFDYMRYYSPGSTQCAAALQMPDGTVVLGDSLSMLLDFGSLLPHRRPCLTPEAEAAGISFAFDRVMFELLTRDVMLASADTIDRILWAAEAKSVDDTDFRPAQWFTQNTRVKPATLRQAARPDRISKRVRSMVIDGVKCYSLLDARRWWPHDMSKA